MVVTVVERPKIEKILTQQALDPNRGPGRRRESRCGIKRSELQPQF